MTKIKDFFINRYCTDNVGLIYIINRFIIDVFTICLILVVISQLTTALTNTFALAITSLFTALLFIYVYRAIEIKYILQRFSLNLNKHPKCRLILFINRLLFFVLFTFFQMIFLIKWGLYVPTSPEVEISIFLSYQQLLIILGLLGFQYEIISQDKFSALTIIFMFIVLIFAISGIWILGLHLSDNAFLGDISTDIVIAITISACAVFYAKVMKWIVKRKIDLIEENHKG